MPKKIEELHISDDQAHFEATIVDGQVDNGSYSCPDGKIIRDLETEALAEQFKKDAKIENLIPLAEGQKPPSGLAQVEITRGESERGPEDGAAIGFPGDTMIEYTADPDTRSGYVSGLNMGQVLTKCRGNEPTM